MEINNKQYIGSYNNDGLIHEWSKDYLDDNGQPIRSYRSFQIKPTENSHNARFNRLRFRMKRGVATSAVTDPKLVWRYRLDQGPWSLEDEVSMGKIGDYDPYVTRHNLGIGREIGFEIYSTDAVKLLLTHMDLTIRGLHN